MCDGRPVYRAELPLTGGEGRIEVSGHALTAQLGQCPGVRLVGAAVIDTSGQGVQLGATVVGVEPLNGVPQPIPYSPAAAGHRYPLDLEVDSLSTYTIRTLQPEVIGQAGTLTIILWAVAIRPQD